MKKFFITSVAVVTFVVLIFILVYFFNEDAKQSFDQAFSKSFNESFKSSFVESCLSSAKTSYTKKTNEPISQMKKGCECIIKAGESEGIFEKTSLEITKYFSSHENATYLISKYKCLEQ